MTDKSQTDTAAQGSPEPIGWLHTLHMELGQIQRRFTFTEPHPFGLPGKHYSPEYWVTSEPLFAANSPAEPTHTLLAAARALVHEIAESGTHERWKRLANAIETEEERAAQPPAAPVETRDLELLAALVYEAMRFAIWSAGQGIMPDEGEPAQGPEDFLYEYSCALEIDDWEGLAEVARDHIRAVPQTAPVRKRPCGGADVCVCEIVGRTTCIHQEASARGPDCACCEQQPRKDCAVPGCSMKDAEWALPARHPGSLQCLRCGTVDAFGPASKREAK